ncbi:hypothetical protein MNV_1250026 [Candidatus Methanoperedens nitroreducens]|uniref:Uncharacterized protein n=1 Tax=Candidatus Methanoperedens nitratireducens TaxID=1392998 RepID=A0A284VK30_9EURY|nr:hypothetical protein MNV_1250026 [Candidatus Methanoperedens nitroreducens]
MSDNIAVKLESLRIDYHVYFKYAGEGPAGVYHTRCHIGCKRGNQNINEKRKT